MYNLIENVDESVSNKVNSEETAVFVESVGGLLSSEARDLDADIDDLNRWILSWAAERRSCAASRPHQP